MVDADRICERATIEHYEPPVYGLEEPLWVAEDAETDCAGIGRVRAEAEGNLVAVVASHGAEADSHVKLPGAVHRRTWQDDGGEGLLDRVRELLP